MAQDRDRHHSHNRGPGSVADITEGFLNSPLMTQFLDDSARKPYAPLRRQTNAVSSTSYRGQEEPPSAHLETAGIRSSEETQYVASPSTIQHA